MPAALYGYCEAKDADPVKFGHGVVMPTKRQTQDYLLCQACEEVLNKRGEVWLAPKLATMQREFPFYDLLTKMPPEWNEPDFLMYPAARNPEIDVEKITHFALGIFWKASVHSWLGSTAEPRIDLGSYSEKVRKWLLGQSGYPDWISLQVTVSTPTRAQIVMSDPYEGVETGCRTFFMHVPGMLFILSTGEGIPPETAAFCFYRNPGHPIFISENLTARVEQLFAGQFLRARKTQAFLRQRERHRTIR